MPIFQRRSDPPQKSNYRDYKPILREDFQYRCAYCLLHEGDPYGGGLRHFQIDHFRPRVKFPLLLTTYSNLYYCCAWCNRNKGQKWPTDDQQQRGFSFVDPCAEDLYETHAKLESDGGLTSHSSAGDYTIREIRLNSRMLKRLRRNRIEAQERVQTTQARISQLEAEQEPQAELISELKDKIVQLTEKYINPKVPYEQPDSLVDT